MNGLIELYRRMLRIRLVEEEIASRYSEQKMRCPTHLSIGQEASAVGVCFRLTPDDKAYSSHRAHAHYLAKGGSLKQLIAELYGKSTGCTSGRGGSMHLCDLSAGFMASTAIVGNSIPLAVGHALHQKVHKQAGISLAFFGDGATEEGAFYESANFAAVKQLPVLFVCENNQYSVYSSLKDRQPEGRSITALSQAIGLTAKEVDGNDIEQVVSVVSELIEGVRKGAGPALIECHTYRHREHCGPNWDDQLGYRPAKEVEAWLKRDPLTLLSNQLNSIDGWEHSASEIRETIQDDIGLAFQFAEDSPFPSLAEVKNKVYAK